MEDPKGGEGSPAAVTPVGTGSDASAAPKVKGSESKVAEKRCSCMKITIWTSAFIVGVMAILCGCVYMFVLNEDRTITKDTYETLGIEGVQMFVAHDRNQDGYLSIQEFESLYHRLADQNPNMNFSEEAYEQPIEDSDNIITLEASFKPLILSTMTKDLNEDYSLLSFGGLDALQGLKSWQTLNKPWMNMAVRHFSAFVPPESLYQAVGEVYSITEEQSSLFNSFKGDLSSNRYFPPHVSDRYVTVHQLLTMFHKRPFLMNRFQPRGGFGVVRAKNNKYLEIVFRIHAEFQLNEPPNYPFWFTPGQFTGTLVISLDLQEILHFNMYVPADKKLNVDMEWLQSDKGMEVDIGYMPEMSMGSTAPSVPVRDVDVNEKIARQVYNPETMKWNEEISMEKALADLEVKLYPFKEVKYYNVTESLEVAKKEDKLVHTILLWGALDDQSC